jgi:predicted esterase
MPSKINFCMKTPVKKSRGSFFCVIIVFLSLMISGCATIAGSFNPEAGADQIAGQAHFTKERVQTQVFTLTAYSRLDNPGQPLTLYIEGDGRAWLSKNRLSDDPTPFHPLALQLASMDPSANVVYLGRPCQYGGAASQMPCDPEYWSNKRFSEEVIASMNAAVDFFAKKASASQIHLVGYSGGAAVAVLVAARRQDVASLRTVAGNLDPEAVNRTHDVGPLTGSLDPLTAAKKISHIPQRHFVGSRDEVVPSFAAENFLKASGSDHCIEITRVLGATHHGGWEEKWKELVKLPVSCQE